MAKQYVAVTVEETYTNTYMLPSINDEGAYLGVTIERIAEEGFQVPGFRKRTQISKVVTWEHSPFEDIDLATLANDIEENDDAFNE